MLLLPGSLGAGIGIVAVLKGLGNDCFCFLPGLGHSSFCFLPSVLQKLVTLGFCFLPHVPDLFQIYICSILSGLHDAVNVHRGLGDAAGIADAQPLVFQLVGQIFHFGSQLILLQLKLINNVDQLRTVQPFEFLVSDNAIPPL